MIAFIQQKEMVLLLISAENCAIVIAIVLQCNILMISMFQILVI